MQKKKLYIDIDGVILAKRNTRPSEDVYELIDCAVNHFDCYWLTTHCKGNNKNVLKYLEQYFKEEMLDKFKLIKSTNWNSLKTEAIDFTSDFFWLEDEPFAAEIIILNQHGALNNLIKVDLNNKDELKRVLNIITFKK